MSSVESVFPPNAPVSRALEQELRRELASGMQVWLDKERRYTRFVDRLHEAAAGGGFAPVVGYRGSFLRMMMELEGKTAQARQSPPLLIHMPGFNEDEVRATPVLAYYHAGKRYRRKLETLIENAAAGRIDPDDIRDYVENHVTTLEAADLWLADKLGSQGDALAHLQLHEIWERLEAGRGAELGDDPGRVMTHLRARVAMDNRWLKETGLEALFHGTPDRPTPAARQFQILGEILLSWAMAVEFVHDLKRPPRTPALAGLPELNKTYVDACRALAVHARTVPHHEDAYVRVASDFSNKLREEMEGGTADDLGRVDTFQFEDERLLAEALQRLCDGDAGPVLGWAEERRPKDSVWLRRDPRRAHVWTLIRSAARLDEMLRKYADPLGGVYTLDDATFRYRDRLWEVDQHHRVLEQKRRRFLESRMPQFSLVKAMCDTVRARYHIWSNRAAAAFAKLCEKDGFLPSKELQQRELFEQVVRPRVKDNVDRLAYVLLDGFRFEMARELVTRLESGSVAVGLQARLAELPSITVVGMNVLAPVGVHGRLSPVLKPASSSHKVAGFQAGAGGFQVTNPDTRRTAMVKRVGGAKCPLLSLDEVLDSPNLKNTLQGFGLAVIHSLDLDEAGEVGQGTAAFDNILMRVASAIRQLRDAGIQRFVITADHGFLLEPPTDAIPANGTVGARYRFDAHGHTGAEVVSVPLGDLHYDGANLHAVFPRDTRCFAVPGGTRNYVHGGNTLQERVIPVLTLDYRNRKGGTRDTFYIRAARVERPGGTANRIALSIRREQQALDFASGAEPIELTLEPVTDGLSLEVTNIGPDAEIAGESSVYALPGGQYEVDFLIRGTVDGRTALRVVAKGRTDLVEPVVLGEFFEVLGRPVEEAVVAEVAVASQESHWGAIEDDGARQVLQHIARHGSITEAEATRMLGGARQFRRFSRDVVELQRYLAFTVRAEASAAGKRYVKE